MAAFMRRWNRWVVAAEAVRPQSLNYSQSLLCGKKKQWTNPWPKAMISKVNSDKGSLGTEKKILEILFLVIDV